MQWIVHEERQIYSCFWVGLYVADVEVPGGSRYEHHLVKVRPSVGVAVVDPDTDRVLMLWRHRFTTNTWNWELPGGWVDPGEAPVDAAAREAEEETGWRPRALRQIAYLQPIAGIADAEQFVYVAEKARYTGPAADRSESAGSYWIPLAAVPGMIERGHIVGGVSVVALQHLMLERRTGLRDLDREPRSAA